MKSEKDNLFNKVTGNPLLYIALSYPYILVVLLSMGFLYINNLPAIRQNSVPPALSDSLKVIPELTIQEPRITSAVDLAVISAPTPAMLEKGKQLYTNTCSSCHGAEGKGDGTAGVALNPKPRNFTGKDGWKNGRKFSQMYKTLQEGIAGSGMPAYDYIPAEDRIAIISHVRTIMPQPDVDSPAEIAKLDETYKLSKGTEQPGTIPVANSEKILLGNNAAKSISIDNITSRIKNLRTENSLLDRVVSNDRLLVVTLINNQSWKTDFNAFQNFLSVNLGKNGLSTVVVSMSKDDLNQIYFLLKGLV